MLRRIAVIFSFCLIIPAWGGRALANEGLDEDCVPGDSVILVVPEDPQPMPYVEVHFCLNFCEGLTYFLQIPVCWEDVTTLPIVWVMPGCNPEFTGCDADPECQPTGDILFDPNLIFWDPSVPGWVVLLMFLPGGQEGCACVSISGEGLGGMMIWHGDCWQILSVELASFSAVPQDENILIEFVTASETDNDYFEIWRSQSPEGAFNKIANIPSQGNSPSGHHYSYVDDEVAAGTTYWYYLADVDLQGNRTEHREMMTSARVEVPVPQDYALLQNYPNPFNASTEIQYVIPEAGHVTLTVFNAMGQEVATLVDAEQTANTYAVSFDASDLPSGIYLYAIEAHDFKSAHKMMLIR